MPAGQLYAEGGGNLDVALQLAQSAKAQLPASASVDDTLGWIYIKKNLAGTGIPFLQSAVRTDSANAVYRYHLGVAYMKSGDKTQAETAFNEALKRNPDFRAAAEAKRTLLATP